MSNLQHTGDTDDVGYSRRQTAMILLGKYAYFGLNFCINIALNPLWALHERQVLMFYI